MLYKQIVEPYSGCKKILLADDDLDDNVVFMDVVNEIDNQINVSIVNDGEELIRTIVENAPNILFLDVFLPFKDGRSCLREIRAMSELKGLPIIMFSALQSDEVIESFYRGLILERGRIRSKIRPRFIRVTNGDK